MTADTAGQSEDGFTFNDVLGMLILDILIYSALAWYAGNVSEKRVVRSASKANGWSSLAHLSCWEREGSDTFHPHLLHVSHCLFFFLSDASS